MSYRPHKRLKATRLEDMCIELICNNMDDYFGEGKKVMELRMKRRVLQYLRGNPVMVSFTEGGTTCCEAPAPSRLASGLPNHVGRVLCV